MKNVLLKILATILAITSLCLFAACGGGEPNDNDPSSSVTDSESGHGGEQTDTEMKLNLGYVVLEVGETADLVVLNYGGGAISWTSSNPSVCEVSGGALTAKAEGGAIITASAGTSSATCRVVVQN
ncbi:MAG: hypothetical protein J5903_03755, partial [Clostridia bacterium]|nr:hypothetical protein [Clostridia bacterium]